MPKLLTCPACGAPLSLDDDGDDIVECSYCKRHVVVATGSLTDAPAKRVVGPPTREPISPRVARPRLRRAQQKLLLKVAAAVAALLLVGAGVWLDLRSNAPASAVNSAELLAKLELSTSADQVTKLFAPYLHPDSSSTIDFPAGSGVVRRVEIGPRNLSGQALSDLTIFSAGGFKQPGMLQRLQALVPNRVDEQGPGQRVFMGDAVLDLNDSVVHVWHWSSVHPANADPAKCQQRLNALWILARAVMFGGRTPTPDELKLVNGPTLEELAALDTSVTVEQAADEFQKKLPAGWCRMQAGLMCVADVDDARIGEARFTWSNALKARLHELKLDIRKSTEPAKDVRALAGCLEPALGKGKEEVVDYVRGTRTFGWTIGDGDQLVLGEGYLTIKTSEKAGADQPAAWPAKLPALFSAIRSCRR